MGHKSEESDLKDVLNDEIKTASDEALPPIEKFSHQIQSVPKIISKAHAVDQVLLHYFHEIQQSANEVVDHLHEERKSILKKFDSYLLPIAKEVLDELIHHADELRQDLDHSLEEPTSTLKKDWISYAKKWVQLYAKWHDKKAITNKVLKLASERTSVLIEKDIKVIQDYQDQTLAGMSKESEEFIDLELRLNKATAEPLRNLVILKNQPHEQLTIKQASEWIENVHKMRTDYFEQVLHKIDSAVKEIVVREINSDHELVREVEDELSFIEQEMKHIDDLLTRIHRMDKEEIHYQKERIDSLLEHLQQYDFSHLPRDLTLRHEKILQFVEKAKSKLT